MNVRRRLVVGVVLASIAAVAVTGYGVHRGIQAHREGWTGVIALSPRYVVSRQKQTKPARAGQVLFSFAGSPADEAGIKAGDTIVSIAGIPYSDLPRLRDLAARTVAGDVLDYRLRRGDRELAVRVHVRSPLASGRVLSTMVVGAVTGLAFLAVAFFVLSRQPGDRRAFIFFVMAVAGGISFLGSCVGYFEPSVRAIDPDPPLNWITILIAGFGLAFLPLTLHLALVFPRDRRILVRHPFVLRWIYAFAIYAVAVLAGFALLIMQMTARHPARTIGSLVSQAVTALAVVGVAGLVWISVAARRERLWHALAARPFVTIVTAIALTSGIIGWLIDLGFRKSALLTLFVACSPALALLLYPVLACIALFRSYREADVEEKRQVQWPLWATIVAVGVNVLLLLLNMGFSAFITMAPEIYARWVRVLETAGIFARASYILIPLSFAFAILKYRLMNIDVIIRKTVAYTFLSGVIIFMYVVLVGGLGTLLLNLTGTKNQTVIVAATLLVALVFVPLRNKLQTLVDRNLFRHKYEYPDALRAIAAEALVASEVAPFLGSAAEKIQRALQNRSVVIFAQRHDEHVATAKVGVSDSLLGTLRVPDRSIREALDRPFDPRRRPLPDEAAKALATIETALVVPINTPGTPPNGFIALGSKLSGAELDVEDIDFLRSVADQLDIGIDRIRQQRDEADVAQARAIQQTLLPREMPRVAGLDASGFWQPARDVGGDYFDLLKLGENELAICIGDVAGKGMSAALLMSGLQASVRVSAFESRSPRELCERVRRVVVSSLSGGRFVTFFYGVLDTAAMRLRWCNAGHNPPILARADGTLVRLAEGGPAISRLCREQSYVENEIDLRAGDRLVLFTDGASEARDARGEMLGEGRLEELVAQSTASTARELQQEIAATVSSHSRGELEDDLTLVVVTV